MAAEHALKKHAEAAAAWETLKAAIEEREQAHRAAGAPGRNSAPVSYRNLASVETVVRPKINVFDVRALELAAEGQRVPTSAEIAQTAIVARKAAEARAVAAVRARSRKEGF